MKRIGWDERHAVKLRAYEHFHGRIVNAQMKCKEDRAYLDEILQDIRPMLKWDREAEGRAS